MNFERIWLYLILAMACLPKAAPGATNTIRIVAQYHCAGGEQLTGHTNLVTLNRIRALPSTAAFRKLAIDKVSALLAGGLGFETNAFVRALISPLLTDLLQTESFGAFGGFSGNVLGFVLALQLDTNRAQLWQDNFSKALGSAGERFTTEGFSGWRWNRGGSASVGLPDNKSAIALATAEALATAGVSPTNSDSFWIVPARDWLLVGRGDDLLPLRIDYLQQVSRRGRPGPSLKENLLEADIDWLGLTRWLPEWSRLLKPARIKVSVAAIDDVMQLTARVVYPQPIPWESAPWQIPTELVRNPLVSFTAAQDVAAFLNMDPAFSQLDCNPLTNQFYAWALGQMPFQTYMAWPVANGTNALDKLAIEAPAAFNPALKRFNGTELIWHPNQKKLIWSSMPLVAPALEVAQDNGRQFLFMSLFPRSPMSKPVPDDLLAQVRGHADLVYYDWELTGPRLQEWRLLSQMMANRSSGESDEMFDANTVTESWLGGFGSLDINTVTEINRVASNELSLVRTSPVGFTGLEMVLFSDWLSNAGAGPANRQPLPPRKTASPPTLP
ncbi:MAG: hypothetical protein ABSH38_17695 [Verrucomicrobiota bacterium]